MNWAGVTGAGEGIEYHLLVLGLCLAALISGGGKWSVDSLITKKNI
jgi:putative oxidoreductase